MSEAERVVKRARILRMFRRINISFSFGNQIQKHPTDGSQAVMMILHRLKLQGVGIELWDTF